MEEFASIITSFSSLTGTGKTLKFVYSTLKDDEDAKN